MLPVSRLLPVVMASLLAAVVLPACDTGDGTTLKEPTAPTTLPPIDTTPLESVAVETSTLPAESPFVSDALIPAESSAASPMQLYAPWADGGTIDPRYGCVGSNVSPDLSWADVPDGTAELAIALVDESNLSNGRPFVHWVMSGITASPESTSLAEGEVPAGAIQALNFFGDVGYAGPCPNPGDTNTYRLTLYALGQQLELADGTPATELLDLVETISLSSTSVSGISTR